jgi:amino acid adenylation domain-containing protein
VRGDTTITDAVDAAIARYPDAVAVIAPDGRTHTYAELDGMADRFASALAVRGVVAGDRVGVCRAKGFETVAALVGIMRLGAAYVPVDPSSPSERNRTIFDDCTVRAIVTDEPALARLGQPDGVAAIVGTPSAPHARERAAATPDDLAYILYTSGSTGRPKGVCLTHRNAMSFVQWCIATFAPGPGDRCSSHAPFHFDLSILDLWMTLASGASVALIDESLAKDPRALAAWIAATRITNWYSVPSILALMAEHGRLDEHDHSALRVVCFAGEVFPIPQLLALRAKWPGLAMWNLYGPTETNVCTALRIPDAVDAARTDPFPIGPACAHCEVRIVDDRGHPLQSGGVGRIICRGAPVMSGYWGVDPAETATFITVDGTRWYDTGDLGAMDADGVVDFRGRRDRMVKRRGYRIELGEIEAGLARSPLIAECAVWSTSDAGEVRIHAAVVAADGAKLGVIALRSHCAAALPPYMAPDRFEVVDALPRTSTGKIDYQSLRAR